MILRILPIPSLGKPSRPGVLADWEIVFTEGPLTGLKMVGGSIRESLHKGGKPYVTLPEDHNEDERGRYSYELLRADETGLGSTKRLEDFKKFVLRTWAEAVQGGRGVLNLSYHMQVVDMDAPLED